MSKRTRLASLAVVGTVLAATYACVEPPPKIAAIPAGGLSVRLHVFGASAIDARHTFDAAKENNKSFVVVKEGGDGEVLVGLDNDSPKCVEPTALCSYKVAYRIKDAKGDVVAQSTTSVAASGEHCGDLCARALNNVVVKVIEAAAVALKGATPTTTEAGAPVEATEGDGGSTAAAADAGAPVEDASAPPAATASKEGKKKPKHGKAEPPPPPPPKAAPLMCSVGPGARLKSEEAERRAAQVDALRRLNVLDQEEYDCLRKAYLERL
jgi:hypothetical protein